MKVTVLGAGAWGTALALVLSKNGHPVTLWGHRPELLEAIRTQGANESYLPGVSLPRDWRLTSDLAEAAAGAEAILLAIPSKSFRAVAEKLHGARCPLLSVTKGIEHETGLTMTSILAECAPQAPTVALSGPTFAVEVARGFPCAIVAAGRDATVTKTAQQLFHRPSFRVYTTSDLPGVELGGALKNVIAIAAGVGDGLGFGDSSKAALVTRALAEMRRLGIAAGALAETFAGLSGLGDLAVTCFSALSRNRKFGERLGRGETPEQLLASPGGLAEGYPTARSAFQLARRLNVQTPVIDEVYAMLYQGKNLADSLRDLTTRSSKAED